MSILDFFRRSPQTGRPDLGEQQAAARQQRAMLVRRGGAARASYDAAQTTHLNTRHWAAADSLSADKANSYSVRKKLRERARYEIANNAHGRGIIDTYAYAVIGTGPRLQIQSGKPALDEAIEREWRRWCRKINLARKLRTMQADRAVSGEGFAIFVRNPRSGHPVDLDIRVLECDRFHSPDLVLADNNVDGVILDAYGNPIRYQMLGQHPGGTAYVGSAEMREYDARDVLHWFRQDRAEQHRGIPEIMPALELFAILRRYTLATLQSAEVAAEISGLLVTNSPAAVVDPDVDAFDACEVERGMLLTAPSGYDLKQLRHENPSATYDTFIPRILTEIGHSIIMARNLATGDSSNHNYASGRLDHLPFNRAVHIIQDDAGIELVDPIFYRWLERARVQFEWNVAIEVDHEWFFDQPEDVDEVKTAKAASERLDNGTSTLPAEYARRGKDYKTEWEKDAEALGISFEEYQRLVRERRFGPKPATNGLSAGARAWVEDAIEETLSDYRQ